MALCIESHFSHFGSGATFRHHFVSILPPQTTKKTTRRQPRDPLKTFDFLVEFRAPTRPQLPLKPGLAMERKADTTLCIIFPVSYQHVPSFSRLVPNKFLNPFQDVSNCSQQVPSRFQPRFQIDSRILHMFPYEILENAQHVLKWIPRWFQPFPNT